MIRAKGLSLGYKGKPAVRGLDLVVEPGEIVALVGGDGAGKTTVQRGLSGQLRPLEGTLEVPPPAQIGVMPARGAVFGDLTVTENLDFARAAHRVRAGAGRQVTELLDRMALEHARSRLASQLSGGMRQKLALAMALLHTPRLLLLDEPTTGVDPVSRAEIWRLLGEEVARGTAVVMATTYLDEAARASSVVLMEQGTPLPQATPAEVRRRTPGTIRRSDRPLTDHAWRRGASWHSWSPSRRLPLESLAVGAADEGADLDDTPVAIPPDLEDAVIVAALTDADGVARPSSPPPGARRGAAHPRPDRPSVTARGATRRFGDLTAVDAADLQVCTGEVVGLLGANGAGKTTLIRMLLGLLPASAGEVELLGGPPTRPARRRVGYVAQGSALYDDLTVGQQRRFHHAAYGLQSAPQGLGSVSDDTLIARLSLGQQRRVAFELARSHDPELLVLDEPTSGVGPLGRARLWDEIHEAAEAGAAVLVTTHYLSEAEQCDRLVVMAAGRVVAAGSVAEIVGGQQVVHVPTDQPGSVLSVLAADGLAGSLASDGVAVPGMEASPALVERVAGLLRRARMEGAVSIRPATLEERFVTLAHDATPAGAEANR